ncbi:MAG: radical SAM protein [Candidatus Micrarchaeota archaeon]|nr:radical SAM protein [Candidatus Micrarchaeota archaeon]
MVSSMRFAARNEPFGMTIYDKHAGQIFVLRGVNDLKDGKVVLQEGERKMEVRPEEIDFIQTVVERNDILVGPTYVEIYPTVTCNERCKFCYMGEVLTYKPTGMPKEVVDAIAVQLRNVGVYQASILGGEPFLYNDLEYLMSKLSDAGINVSVSTNGTVLNKALFRKLTDMNVRLNFSFHSHIPEVHDMITNMKGGFALSLKTLEFLRSIDHPPHISIVANSVNINHLSETVDFVCRTGGVTAISVYHAMKSGFARSGEPDIGVGFSEYVRAFKLAEEKGKEYGVKVRVVTNFPFLADQSLAFDRNLGELANFFYGAVDGRSAVYINYDGTVYSSSYQFGAKELAMGNVLKEDLRYMWNSSPAVEQFRTASPPAQCSACEHFDICRGGPISNYAPTFLRKSQDEHMSCPLKDASRAE